MAQLESLGPVADRARKLFPMWEVRIEDLRSPEYDASYVAALTFHDPNIVTAEEIDGISSASRARIYNGPRYECPQTFHTVEEVNEYRQRICFLDEKEEHCFPLSTIDHLWMIDPFSETEE